MNSNENVKILKEALSKFIDENIEADINKGEKLLERCRLNYNADCQCFNRYNMCQYKDEVIGYINDINQRYSYLIRLFNTFSGSSGGTGGIKCYDIGTYVDFLRRVKKAKENTDNLDKMMEEFMKVK